MASNDYSILAIANSVENDTGEFGTHRHMQYIRWILEGYRELNFNILKEIRTISVPLNSYNAVELDLIEGYVDWTKVAVQKGDKVWALGTADDIALLQQEDDCGVRTKNIHQASMDDRIGGLDVDTYAGLWFYNWQGTGFPESPYYDGQTNCMQAYWGWPFDGLFRHNKERRQLQFSSNFREKEVYMEFISDGSNSCEETCVNPYIFDYLRKYCHVRRVEHRQDISMAEKDMKKRDLSFSYAEAERRMQDVTFHDIVNRFRKNIQMFPHH